MPDIFEEIGAAVMAGRAQAAKEWVRRALAQGLDARAVMDRGLVAAMTVIGRRFKADEIFMPEVMIAARAMNAALEVLDPVLAQKGGTGRGKVVLGTVRGDLHDVGKNMVSMMFRGAGLTVVDLGVDVAEEAFVQAIRDEQPDIVALSALLTMTMPKMETTIQAIGRAGLRARVVVMVGGAPVTQAYAEKIGADGWAPDAASATEKAVELLAARIPPARGARKGPSDG